MDISGSIANMITTIVAIITVALSLSALIVSILSLQKTRNERRPYLSISFNVDNESIRLSNYGLAPALLNEVSFLPEDLAKLEASDPFGALIPGETADKPFKDLEGTVIGPGLDYCFYIDSNAEAIKKNPYITATLRYDKAKKTGHPKSSYDESFKINLHPKQGSITARHIQHIRQSSDKDQ